MSFWSRSENDRFERAVAIYEEGTPGRWELVAAAVGGGKTVDDVIAHYALLEHEIRNMEAEHYRQQQHQHAANANPNNANANANNRNHPNGNGNVNGTANNSNNNRRGSNSANQPRT
ncbi:unnamed protein product [Urochloa humidicola]